MISTELPQKECTPQWSANLILIDADYLDSVAIDLIVNFERMIGRRIPQADLCHWLNCIALDGGLRQGKNDIQVVFLHGKEKKQLLHFIPSNFETDLNGKAFTDAIGEFTLQSFPVEKVISTADFFIQSLEAAIESQDVKNIMVIADMDTYGERVKSTAVKAENKEVMLFSMQPLSGRGFLQEILGYSLMSALGIRSEELR